MWPRGPVASEGGFQSTTGLTLGCVGVGCGCGCFRRCRDCDFYVELEGEFQSETGPMPGCGGLVDVGGDVGVDVDVVDSVCIFLRGIRGQVLVYNCVDGEMLELSADVDANVGVGVDVDIGDDVYVVVDVSVLLCGIRGQVPVYNYVDGLEGGGGVWMCVLSEMPCLCFVWHQWAGPGL